MQANIGWNYYYRCYHVHCTSATGKRMAVAFGLEGRRIFDHRFDFKGDNRILLLYSTAEKTPQND